MQKYRIYQVDAFTREKLRGNPAGVVPHADGLTEAQMQSIARELNNSETAFVFRSDSPEYDVHVRFFTPMAEVPICGHATVAAHYVRAKEGSVQPGRTVQKTGAGILPVDIVPDGDDFAITMTQGTPTISEPLDVAACLKIADALHLDANQISAEYPVAIASTGNPKVMFPIRSNESLHALQPDLQKLKQLSGEIGCTGFYVFTLNPGEEVLVHGRMFSPAIGIAEDPVTGTANGPLGAYLVHFDLFQQEDACFDFDILQGEAIHRTGRMHVHVEKEAGAAKLVQISGNAVIAFCAEIEL